MLTVDGQRLNPLSVDDLQYFETRFFLVPGTGTVYVDAKLSVIRQRAVGGGFHEELTILNHDEKAADLEVRIEAGSRLRRPVRGQGRARRRRASTTRRVDDGRLVLGYQRETFVRETWVSATAACAVDEHGLTFERPRRAARRVDDRPARDAGPRRRGTSHRAPKYERHAKKAAARSWSGAWSEWLDEAPALDCDWDPLKRTYRAQPGRPGGAAVLAAVAAAATSLPAAGLPWFMTMFGRDSILTSLQALPFTPELAATTLRALGLLAGQRGWTTSATRSPAASCTSCATAR